MHFIIYLSTLIYTYTIIAAFVGVGRKKYPSSTPSFNTFKYDSNFLIDM